MLSYRHQIVYVSSCDFEYIYMWCVLLAYYTRTHMIRTKHKGEREWEERRDDGEGGKETIFIFQPRRRKMSGRNGDSEGINICRREQKTGEKGRQNEEYIYYIYNQIFYHLTMSIGLQIRRSRGTQEKKLLHDCIKNKIGQKINEKKILSTTSSTLVASRAFINNLIHCKKQE
jgi:hypothetical protein